MRNITLVLFFLFWNLNAYPQNTNQSLPYADVISQYKILDEKYDQARLFTYGLTDCGIPLHLFVISKTKIFDPARLHELKKCILFVNNGIHPGEPDGIDASIKFAEDLLSKPLLNRILENVVVCIIPVFNIDGALERGCCSRVNQNGPENYGFRGNAKNLDLNRDFIKEDSRNTKSLISILRKWDPDVTIDTHVSDGADYQYTMTLITAQHSKLNPIIGKYIHDVLSPSLFNMMEDKEDEICHYVNTDENFEVPDSGIIAFLESPRFLNGYQSLFNNFSFISESHMLKPFSQRMKSTYNILSSLAEICNDNSENIIAIRKMAFEEDQKMKNFYYNWKINKSKKELIEFRGYQAEMKPSNVTGGQRLYYNKTKPYTKKIPFYNYYLPADTLIIPKYFVIPQAWSDIIKQLENNGVRFINVNEDTTLTAIAQYVSEYETVKHPYEGHYLHYDVKTKSEELTLTIKKGDYLIPMPQMNMRYALETLTPGAIDSYFNWGYFDSFLQQKEWFSPYVYEDIAEELLSKNEKIKSEFENWKKDNASANEFEQLKFIYQHSPDFEKTFMRYPIFFVY